MLTVDFWNGNRSEIRQDYEREVLEALLEATTLEFGPWKISESRADYPGKEESLAFSEKNHDLLVTIAGNQKFKPEDILMISKPLARNLLGYRILIIKNKDTFKFKEANSKDIKQLTLGIPETWSDADIFRTNEFKVQRSVVNYLLILIDIFCLPPPF